MRIKSGSSGVADTEARNAEENFMIGDGTEAVRDVDFESSQTIDKGVLSEISKLDMIQTLCEEGKGDLVWELKGSNGTRSKKGFASGSNAIHHHSDQLSEGRVIVFSGSSLF